MPDTIPPAKQTKPLPQFKPRASASVQKLLTIVLTNPASGDQSHLVSIEDFPDGHYRAWFLPSYFILADQVSEPTKSQWNTLKKKLKRHDVRAFVFKDYGSGQRDGQMLYYLDFGFFAR